MSNKSINDEIMSLKCGQEQVDGEKIIIKCSSCDRELIEVWITRPNAPIKSEIVATCCCGDKSFRKTVMGFFNLGETEKGESQMVDMKTDVEQDENGNFIQKLTVITQATKR